MSRRLLAFDVSDCPLLQFAGPDRAKTLHNLTTQEIKALQPGEATEAFVTSPQGKTLGFFTLHVTADAILARCEPGGTADALPHLSRYAIFDDVTFEEVTARFAQVFLLGEGGWEMACRALFGDKTFAADVAEGDSAAAGPVIALRWDHFGVPGVVVLCGKGRSADGMAAFEQAGCELARDASIDLERLRVMAAWPRFGAEIRADNLPQEIDRDATAISFRKGCYLGQETVARLDALGHVNRVLRYFVAEVDGGALDAASLASRALVGEAGSPVGEIRSAVAGPEAGQVVGAALVRVKALEGAIRIQDRPEARLTLLPPAEFRERFGPFVRSLAGIPEKCDSGTD